MKLIPELKPGDNILSAEFREVFNELVRRVNMQIVGDDEQIAVDVIPDIAYVIRGIKQLEEIANSSSEAVSSSSISSSSSSSVSSSSEPSSSEPASSEGPEYVEVIKAGTLQFTFNPSTCEVEATYESVKILTSAIVEEA